MCCRPQSQLLKDLSASTKAENGNVRTKWRLKAFHRQWPQHNQGRQMRIFSFQFLFPSQTSHVLSIFNFSWLSFPFLPRSFSICHCDKRDSKFNVLVGKAWTGRWFHFRIVSEYKSKFFFAEIYSIQFRLMKGFLSRNRWEWSMC